MLKQTNNDNAHKTKTTVAYKEKCRSKTQQIFNKMSMVKFKVLIYYNKLLSVFNYSYNVINDTSTVIIYELK